MRFNPKLRPIRFRAGALEKNVPSSDPVVFPQHRLLVGSKVAMRRFGAMEVLVAARQLLGIDHVDIADDLTAVGYFHVLFERHEWVIANGTGAESLYTGPQTLKAVGRSAQDKIFAIFPELRNRDDTPEPARMIAPG